MKLNLIKYNKVKSTNDVALKLLKSNKKERGIIISNIQTNGKGTMGKKWISLKGNFFVSIFFELRKNMPNPKEFSLINPIIIKNILIKYTKLEIKIKWPNDLLINSKKVCGILQEFVTINKKNFLIIGIGINTIKSPNNSNFKSTSLLECSNKSINNYKILKNIRKNYELSNWRYWKHKYKNL